MVRFLWAILAGVGMGLTVAPVSWWLLAWISLVPLWIIVRLGEKSLKKQLLSGFGWGFAYHGLALFWITGIHPMTWMGVPWLASLLIALFCWLFITFWGTAIVLTWTLVMFYVNKSVNQSSFRDALLRVFIGTALWCGLESLWSQSPLWWTTLAYSQSPHNLLILQLGKLSGFTTVTAAIVAVNGLIAESLLLIRQSRQNLAFLSLPLLICFSLHLWGWNTYHKPIEKSRDLGIKIGVIQGNIPNTIKLSPLGFQKALEGYTSGYQILADQGVDAVLTPETALPYYWENLVNNSSIYSAILAKKTPIWLGAFGKVDKGYNNSLLTIDGEGEVISRYDKVILVPLGEYVPFQEILGGIVDRLSPLQAHLIPGDPDQIIDSPFGKIIVGICYESAFSEHFRRQTARGGEFIITASNNAHYSHAMPAQHHAQDTMRAIETDRWMARATNTGYSAFVDPHGNQLWLSDLDKYQIHSETIYRRDTRTLYVRWGDWLTKVLIITAGLAWLWRAWD